MCRKHCKVSVMTMAEAEEEDKNGTRKKIVGKIQGQEEIQESNSALAGRGENVSVVESWRKSMPGTRHIQKMNSYSSRQQHGTRSLASRSGMDGSG
ncbi:hypothetical protein BO99DRAFT_32227 [Aspergillus violaceofuscus CBS 115571]|uniref:Uncharacterized protein n=1 Tax=Aspergillus violaceofuscus (strain CBS 115571) TaxID=1450538 RepID=A0A2V5HCU4_ASPV1|nr:hypothetical protein BO99DRAFT_32227 [Aspergillus violaceofuscus CBS 115571]